MEDVKEVTRNGSLEMHLLLCHGVDELQHTGMERQAINGRYIAATILAVAYHRMPQTCQMHADLVRAARLQVQLHQRVAGAGVERREVRGER